MENKKIRQVSTEGHPTNYLSSTPQNCKGHQKQEKTESAVAKRNLSGRDN